MTIPTSPLGSAHGPQRHCTECLKHFHQEHEKLFKLIPQLQIGININQPASWQEGLICYLFI